MNEPVAALMQGDALPGPIILKRTDRVISSGVTCLLCYQGHPPLSSVYKQRHQAEMG